MKKFISFLLAAVLLVSAVPTALATNDYSQGTQVVYQATGSENYTITVPAQLAPGGSGTVTLEGTWADNRIITVTADPTVTLTNSIKAEDQKVLNVHFDGISEAGSNTTSQTFTQGVSVDGITNALFGTWSGKFNYNVEVRSAITSYTAQKLCLEHDLGYTTTQGEGYNSSGKYVTDSSGRFTDFVPAEVFVGFDLANNSTSLMAYSIYDKDKNFIRGHWDMSDFSVDPSQGDAYVVVMIAADTACCWVSYDINISTQSKTFEIFGDSWSAFDTSIVEGRTPYYGATGQVNDAVHGVATDITSNSEMWYSLLEQQTGWELVRNDSASGSCMSYSYYGGEKDDPHGTSYITRMRDRFEGSGANLADPDVIFVFGGTNDYGANAELGEAMYSGWTESDLNDVFPATCYILDYLKQQAPNTKVIFIMPHYTRNQSQYGYDMMAGIKDICNYYNVDCISWCFNTISVQGAHPDIKGMTQITDQIIYDLDRKGIF